MPSSHLILCRPLLFLPSIFPSIRVFSNESALRIQVAKYWSFNFSISASNEYSGLISFRIDWFDLVVQGTLTSLLQHHRINSSVCSLLYGSALTCICDYWKNHSFDYMDLCWQSDVTAFLPRSKCLLISWLQSPSIVNLEPRKRKCHCFHFFPIYLPWSDGTGCHDLKFSECWVLTLLFHSHLSPSLRGFLALRFLSLGW